MTVDCVHGTAARNTRRGDRAHTSFSPGHHIPTPKTDAKKVANHNFGPGTNKQRQRRLDCLEM
jgi:hypothetical protein